MGSHKHCIVCNHEIKSRGTNYRIFLENNHAYLTALSEIRQLQIRDIVGLLAHNACNARVNRLVNTHALIRKQEQRQLREIFRKRRSIMGSNKRSKPDNRCIQRLVSVLWHIFACIEEKLFQIFSFRHIKFDFRFSMFYILLKTIKGSDLRVRLVWE